MSLEPYPSLKLSQSWPFIHKTGTYSIYWHTDTQRTGLQARGLQDFVMMGGRVITTVVVMRVTNGIYPCQVSPSTAVGTRGSLGTVGGDTVSDSLNFSVYFNCTWRSRKIQKIPKPEEELICLVKYGKQNFTSHVNHSARKQRKYHLTRRSHLTVSTLLIALWRGHGWINVTQISFQVGCRRDDWQLFPSLWHK